MTTPVWNGTLPSSEVSTTTTATTDTITTTTIETNKSRCLSHPTATAVRRRRPQRRAVIIIVVHHESYFYAHQLKSSKTPFGHGAEGTRDSQILGCSVSFVP